MSKLIITCAVTGSIHTPSMSPHLPVTVDQIATQSIDAAEAGAGILHLHARDPQTSRPSASAEQVVKIREIVERLGHTIATPTDAREMLGLNGANQTAF
jgi:uncharacterized protein (DUF849 family)